MSKFLRTAALVVGAVALAATGIGAAADAAVGLGGVATIGTVATSAIAEAAGLGAAGLGVLSQLTAKKPAQLATPTEWQSDPQAGVPHVSGRMFVSGQIVYRATFDKDNVNQTINTVYSTGPIQGFEGWYFSGVLSPIDGNGHPTNVVDGQKIYLGSQLGRQPEPQQLGGTNNPGITATSKLSGLAASTITLSYDTTGGHTFTTEPNIGAVVLGTPVYDARQDSTYPGGAANGPQRSNDETTWSFAHYDNPGLKALAWLIGYRQNGYVVAGVGLPISSINVAQFVEMANVCDANGWTCGFEAKSTDNPWQVFTQILQAGGAVPTRSGAITGCMVNTPKVSLATFEIDDIIGDWSIQATQSRRDRINAILPRYMAEQSITGETTDSKGNVVLQTTVTWGMQPAGAIAVASYAAEDGGQRLKGVDYPYVTGVETGGKAPNQVAQLARYDIENAREFGPISLPMKPRWMGYRAGDVITGGASLTELGLVGQDIMIMQRQFSPANMTVTITARSETYAKHAFALGQTTTAPPTPMLSGPPLIPVPGAAAWALTAGVVASANGTSGAALFLNGAPDSQVIDAIVVEMRVSTGEQDASADWEGVTTLAASFSGQLTITGVQDHTDYQVAVSYRKGPGTSTRLILGPATAGQTAVPWSAGVVGAGKPADNADVTGDNVAKDVANVAGREAATLVSDVDLNAQTLLSYQFDQQTLRDYVNGYLFVAGVPVNTAITNESQQRIAGENAIAQTIALIGAKNSDGSAFALNLTTAQVGNGLSLSDRLGQIDTNAAGLVSTNQNLAQVAQTANNAATGVNNVTTQLNTVTSQLGAANSAITNIQEAVTTPSGSASAKAVMQLASNGHVVGYAATNDGSTGAIVFDFDNFTLLRPDGTVLIENDGDTLKLHSVEIDTLSTNTAVVPVRASATSSVSGTHTGGHGTVPTTAQVLSTTIVMPQAGWIEVSAAARQMFASIAGGTPWLFQILIDGTVLPESNFGGEVPGDSVSPLGAMAVAAGSHTVTLNWNGHTSITLTNRSMFVKGYPSTS